MNKKNLNLVFVLKMFLDFLCDIRPIIQILFLKYCVVFGEAKDKGKKEFSRKEMVGLHVTIKCLSRLAQFSIRTNLI